MPYELCGLYELMEDTTELTAIEAIIVDIFKYKRFSLVSLCFIDPKGVLTFFTRSISFINLFGLLYLIPEIAE